LLLSFYALSKNFSLRANNKKADDGVIPPLEEQLALVMNVISFEAGHMDFCDRAPEKVKQQINLMISRLLKD
jgi:hypothetical protein